MENIDKEAEKGIISTIYNYGQDSYLEVSDIVSKSSFVDDLYQIMFRVADYHFKKDSNNIDLPQFLSYCNMFGYSDLFSKSKVLQSVKEVYDLKTNKDSVRKLAVKIRKLEITRELKKRLDSSKTKLCGITGEESLREIFSLAEEPIFDLTNLLSGNTDGPEFIFKNIDDYLDYLESNPVKQLGLSTGFNEYDLAIGGGLRRKTVNLFAARAKKGKSFICSNVSLHNVKNNVPVLYLDTELSKEDQTHRMLACVSGIDINSIETGQYVANSSLKSKVREAAKVIKELPFKYQNISGVPFEDVLSLMRRWIVKDVGFENGTSKDCLIIYDYIKMVNEKAMGNLQEYQALGFLMTGLHNFMVKYGCPCLAPVQLNRDGITREETDTISGSDRLVWFCSSLTLFRDQSEEEISAQRELGIRQFYNKKMIPIATRHGAGLSDGDYINVRFDGRIGRITEGPLQSRLRSENNQGFVTESNEPF